MFILSIVRGLDITRWLGLTCVLAALTGALSLYCARPSLQVSAEADSLKPRSNGARADTARLIEGYGNQPLSFEANAGQADARVQFISRGEGYKLFLTPTEATLALDRSGAKRDGAKAPRQSLLRMRLEGASATPRAAAQERLPGRVNYFVGRDPSGWRTGIDTYGRVHYAGVYPGVDLVYHGNRRELEYDFIVAPGADPSQITLAFDGAQKVSRDPSGDLVLLVGGEVVRQLKPFVYQEEDGVRREVAARYVIKSGCRVGFEVGSYDANRPLVIDPVLVYWNRLGGGAGEGIVADAYGNAYVTGWTLTPDYTYPTASFPTTPGAFQTAGPGHYDAFVTKLDPAGQIIYSTYLGGTYRDMLGNNGSSVFPALGGRAGGAIAVDALGNAYVTGPTMSNDFPTTPGAFQQSYNSSSTWNTPDAFVAKLDPNGSTLLYSTYLGGSCDDETSGIAVDADGNAYVTGTTCSNDFPITPGAFQANAGGSAFVTKLDAEGSALVYSTYLGGGDTDCGYAIALDPSRNAYVVGMTKSTDFPVTAGAAQPVFAGNVNNSYIGDAFVTKLDAEGTSLIYSTYLGGEGGEDGRGVAADAAGNTYVTGITQSTGFPVTPGAFQPAHNGFGNAFVTKLNPAGTAFVYSTYLGDEGSGGHAVAVDADGNAYVVGSAGHPYFPLVNPIQTYTSYRDIFVSKLNAAGSALLFSTYLSTGNFNDDAYAVALDPSRDIYVTGMITVRRGYDLKERSVFVTKINVGDSAPVPPPAPAPTPTPWPADGVVSGRVITSGGTPLGGVTVQLNGYRSGTTTTDGDGRYSFEGLQTGVHYTVIPSKVNYSFDPPSQNVKRLVDTQVLDFTASLVSYTISGHIIDDLGRDMSGVTVTLSGSQTQTALTDTWGSYSFTVLATGNYTVTPSKLGYNFKPTSLQFNNLSDSQWSAHFRGTLIPAVPSTPLR